MSRDINLLNPALRPRKRVLTPAIVAGATGCSVLVVLGAGAWENHRLTRANVERARLTTELRALQDTVKRVSAQTPATASPALVEEQNRLQRELEARRALADRLDGADLGNTQGFSAYLVALSRRTVNGLWITGFGASGSGDDLSIRGRVLRPELVSEYLEGLGADDALRGRSLAGISLRAVDITPPGAAPSAETRDAAKPAPTVRVIEFTLGAAVRGAERQGASQ